MTDTQRTPETAADVLRAIMDAGVSLQAARMLAAQSAFETADFAYIWNYNLGNITTNDADYVILPGNDLHFKPYASLADGATGFVEYLTARGLLPFAETGDLQGYVDRLQAIHYAGDGDYTAYYNGMAGKLQSLYGVTPSPPMRAIAKAGIILLLGGVVAVGIHGGVFGDLRKTARRLLPREITRALRSF